MTNWAAFAGVEVPALIGVGFGMRAYARESYKSWKEQYPEDAAREEAQKAAKKAAKQNRNLNSHQFGNNSPVD